MSREALERDVEDFVRAGGTIKQLAPGEIKPKKQPRRLLTSRTRYVRQRVQSHYKMHGTLSFLAEFSEVPETTLESILHGVMVREAYITILERSFDQLDNSG